MKVLILTNDSDGFLIFRYAFAKKIVEAGNQLTVCLPRVEIKESDLELYNKLNIKLVFVDIDRRGINIINDFKLYRQYKKIIKEIKPDKIIAFTIKCNIYGAFATNKKTPFYANITGLGSAFQTPFLKKIVVTLYKIAFRKKAKLVFFENSHNLGVFVDNKIVPAQKTVLLNGAGVDLVKFSYHKPDNHNPKRFIFVGRIMKDKGVEELFSVIERLRQNNFDAEFSFFGDMEENYTDKIHSMQKEGLIFYHGKVNNIIDHLKNSSCFILPSYHEGMSNALLEACSVGLPVIASNINGCKEAVIDGESGFLVEAKNANSLYSSVLNMINLPYEQLVEFGKKGRQLMESKFNKEVVVKEMFLRVFD